MPTDLSAPGSPLQKALGLIDAMQAKAVQPAAGRRAASEAATASHPPAPAPGPPSMQRGGLVPRTGTYTLHRGETVVPNDIQRALAEGHVQAEDVFGSPEELAIPEGKWFVHSKTGIPFQARENPDPDNTWRLVFDDAQLADAFPDRLHQGYPILVDPGILHARDWLTQLDKARVEQYENPDARVDYLRLHGGLTPAEGIHASGDPSNAYLGVRERLLRGLITDPIPGVDLDHIRGMMLSPPPANAMLDAYQGAELKGYPGQLEPAH